MDDAVFLAHLNKYPALRKRMEEILNVAGDLTECLNLADDAEGALIENSRHLNREALQAWASNKATQAAAQFEKNIKKHIKTLKKTLLAQYVRKHRSNRTGLSHWFSRLTISTI